MGGSLITEVKETINEKIKEEADGKIGLEYEIDVETETFEMFQMPSLSRGKYLHDFKVHIQAPQVRLNMNEKKPSKSQFNFPTLLGPCSMLKKLSKKIS